MRTYIENQLTVADLFSQVLGTLTRLIHRARLGINIGDLEQLEIRLQTLPLASDDFGIAINRLSNARRYLQSAEMGAACWELNTLANQIRAQANTKTAEPRRRLRR